jgi:WD40 repeat protein
MAWSPDSKIWATGDESGYVAMYDTAGVRRIRFNTQSNANVIAWSPDGTKIVVSNEVWRPDGTEIGTLPGMGTYVTALAWSPDGQIIAAGSGRNVVAVFSPDGQQLYRFAIGAPATEPPSVNRIAWSPDGKILAAGYSDNVARLWRVGGQ